ncbi:unnamed protein product [Macrosiphum euphorbiae]|uniref:Uncharacterized protein n=1 Tax=Macrosiphum euphorbiae TaxID=13131 RepID=A0AAV0WK30_9HEMI|nr:unnamed protein product [Macrosiphum euphorbiae]
MISITPEVSDIFNNIQSETNAVFTDSPSAAESSVQIMTPTPATPAQVGDVETLPCAVSSALPPVRPVENDKSESKCSIQYREAKMVRFGSDSTKSTDLSIEPITESFAVSTDDSRSPAESSVQNITPETPSQVGDLETLQCAVWSALPPVRHMKIRTISASTY